MCDSFCRATGFVVWMVAFWSLAVQADAASPSGPGSTGAEIDREATATFFLVSGDGPQWEPMPPPAELHGPVGILALVIDGSGSMRRRSLSPRARAAAQSAVMTAERCTYVIVADFGWHARVVADRFACSPYDRKILLDAIESVPMNQNRTDVGVLEVLLAEIRAAVGERYADHGFRMEVKILTDAEPMPLDPSEEQTFDIILESPTVRTELGDGLFLFGLTLAAAPRQAHTIASEPAADPDEDGTPPGPPSDRAASDSDSSVEEFEAGSERTKFIAALLGLGAALLFAALLAIKRRRARGRAPLSEEDRGAEAAAAEPVKSPAALRVTEWQVAEEGERVQVQEPFPVHYTPDVPISIGADEAHVLIGLRTAGMPARVASLQLDGRGNGTLIPTNGTIRLDGEEVGRRPVPFDAEDPHVITIGAAEIVIEPVTTLPETEEAFYRRLTEEGGEPTDRDTNPAGTEGTTAEGRQPTGTPA